MKGRSAYRRLLFVGLGASVVLVGLVVAYARLSTNQPILLTGLFHGPRYDSSTLLPDTSIVASVVHSISHRQTRPTTTRGQTGGSTATTTTGSTSTTTPTQTTSASKTVAFGIAAGGGLTDLDQPALNTYFQALKTLGVQWVRWDIDWGVVQPDDATHYNWAAIDRVAATAKQYGINSLAILTYTPAWAYPSGCTMSQCLPADPSAFATFAGAAAARYKDTIHTWEIWNEPNVAPNANVAVYSTVLRGSYSAIKAVDPSAMVLSGGLAPAADGGGNIAPATFVQALYADQDRAYFDALALHPYTYPVSVGYQAIWNSWLQMAIIQNSMQANGDGAKKIWITEFGSPTNGPGSLRQQNQLTFVYGSDYLSEQTQQTLLQDALAYYIQNSASFGPFFFYSLHDNGTNTNTPENFFGLLRYDWSQKPAYQTFQQTIAQYK